MGWQSGEILDDERIKQVRQVVNYIRSSKNTQYCIVADTVGVKGKAVYTVYDTQTKMVKSRFVAQNQLNEATFDVINDGEFAVCSAYQREGVSLIKVDTGEVIWTRKDLSKISKVYFDKDDKKVVVYCRYAGIYFLKIQNGETASYDKKGKLVWENKEANIGKITYQEENETICGVVNVRGEGKIMIISAKDGKTLCEVAIDDYACAFIDNQKTLLCNTGKMYDVSDGKIEERTEIFEFLVRV